MRILSRSDASLACSLVVAAFVLFRQPLKQLLDAVAAVEAQYHLDFLPALTVLSVALAFTQYRKRMEVAAEARLSRARSEELERLLGFGTSLAGSLDEEGLQRTLYRQLPAFFGERSYWLLARRESVWVEVARAWTSGPERSIEAQEQLAEQALLRAAGADADQAGIEFTEGDVCFPLIVGATVVGVLGVQNAPRLSPTERRACTAAVAPLALALRNLHFLHELQQRGIVDRLTGCLNRETGIATLRRELRRARRTGRPLSILMIDIDHFKTINDTRGHLAGDAALQRFGARLIGALRTTDMSCRFGGDEFLVILPETPLEGAARVAAKLKMAIGVLDAQADGNSDHITLSVGIAQADRGEEDVASLIGRADGAMYRAKHAGRDTFQVASIEESAGDEGHQPVMARSHK